MASSSRRGRARKSGAGQTTPQQDPPQQDPVPQETPIIQIAVDDPKLRKIEYQASYNFIPDMKVRRANHPILKFELSTPEWNKYDKLKNTDLLQHRVIDWLWLSEIGPKQEVRDLLGQRLIDALECIQPQYEELVLEFHSTWLHKEGKFEQDTAMSFSLGRQVYEMNMARFAIVSGFYTEEEVKRPEFVTSLRGAYSKPRDYGVGATELREFWSTISDHLFTTTNLITSVRNPVYRYVLMILSTTLVGQKSGENKANWIELFILMCRVQNREINLATVLADSISRSRRGGPRAGLDMGPYITRIARNLGVLDKYLPEFLHEGPKTVTFGLKELQQAGIVSWMEPYDRKPIRQGPQVQPPEGHPAEDVMLQIDPTHRQRPPQRHELLAHQYPRRQPPPAPLTLESFSVYVEQRFDRLEHLILTGQDRQEDALRYIMSRHSMGIPDFFQPRQEGNSAGTAERFDPIPPIRVFGEGSSGAGGREESSHESDSEHDED
ncbi:hypothetical protein HanXRQr2_Chr09g0391511 [Helianthus annuus]|uniref:Uncharacterized protein n=1 Tax=Helianthus annuus TaxID=4232 RepID=A0A9K3I639_HELAN|nr:hypothetical protein HanXRQr2_Chr09g0391511 [Helianthus annuus]KAJ0534676.1 hypothetical protein HanIR_Chr09g0422371 [Helianthus annuus]